MSTFETIDDTGLALRIREARERVLLCSPGFGDPVASALIEAYRRLGSERVVVVVDGTAQAARLGYGHFDAVGQLSQAGRMKEHGPVAGRQKFRNPRGWYHLVASPDWNPRN